jgi:hypothetical protein
MREVSQLLGMPEISTTAGSTIPRIFFSDIAAHMGLEQSGTMPVMARRIIEANNLTWSDSFSSENTVSGGGSTVTALGLLQVKNAVLAWLNLDFEDLNFAESISEWEPAFDWIQKKSELERMESTIVNRPGAQEFRAKVLKEYENRCAVTGSTCLETIDVAHIVPYHGIESDHVQNAIPLRADLHRLFDRGLIRFDYSHPKTEILIQIDNQIREEYGDLVQKKLTLPINPDSRPSLAALYTKNYLLSTTDE